MRRSFWLFFIILAWLADAALLHLADRAAAARLLKSAARSGAALESALRDEGHRSIIQLMTDPARRTVTSEDDALAAQHFEDASRRFVRSLVSMLPLLGFLGTVIGLARAISELHLGAGDAAGLADFSGTLSGLAIKFETTLLGLIASMIASLLIGLFEKRETEFAAACVLASVRMAKAPERST